MQSGDGEESSSDAGASDTEGEPRAKQEPLDYDDAAAAALPNSNGALPHNFPNLLNLPGTSQHSALSRLPPNYCFCYNELFNLTGFPGLPGPSGMPDNFGK